MKSNSDSPGPFPTKRRAALLLGLGLDGADDHVRVTRGQEFCLLGGSHDTHQAMQEKAIRFTEELDRRGKRLADVSRDELLDIADRTGLAGD